MYTFIACMHACMHYLHTHTYIQTYMCTCMHVILDEHTYIHTCRQAGRYTNPLATADKAIITVFQDKLMHIL